MDRAATLATLLAAAVLAVPATARADMVVNASHRTAMFDCNDEAALVNGDANRVVFRGDCRSLRVSGSGNQVEIDLRPGGGLTVAGSRNRVLYTPIVPGPAVALRGADNSVAAGSFGAASAALAPPVPAAPPAPPVLGPTLRGPGTLLLPGDGLTESVDCTGRNVLIEGSGGRYTLRGGCRSVTVQGHRDTVRAELQPGSRIAIGGDGVTLHYRLTQAGPPPVISITGNASQALNVGSTAVIGSPAQ